MAIPRTWIKFDWRMQETLREIDRMVANLDTVSPLALDEWGDILVDAIRSYTPRDTGESQASIGKYNPDLIDPEAGPEAYERAQKNAIYKMRRVRADTWELVVGSNYDVVAYLNYGTKNNQAHYMFERGQVAAAQYLRPTVRKAIDASIRPASNLSSGRWRGVTSTHTFNPGVSGGGGLIDGRARRKLRLSQA